MIFFSTMVLSGLLMDLVFTTRGLVPTLNHDIRARMTRFSLNYTFWLNLLFGASSTWLVVRARRHPMDHHAHMHHGGHDMASRGHHEDHRA